MAHGDENNGCASPGGADIDYGNLSACEALRVLRGAYLRLLAEGQVTRASFGGRSVTYDPRDAARMKAEIVQLQILCSAETRPGGRAIRAGGWNRPGPFGGGGPVTGRYRGGY